MWHASARAESTAIAKALAETALAGVGDPTAGEWRSRGPAAFHLRRRLTEEEAADMKVRDIRGTAEERRRLEQLAREAPHARPYIGRLG